MSSPWHGKGDGVGERGAGLFSLAGHSIQGARAQMVGYLEQAYGQFLGQGGGLAMGQLPSHANSSSSTLASWRSGVSNPSVNQP